ncbi:MAG: hypothetical protein Q9227_006615 [Pyrenula ochraceoflavens]
MDDVRGQVLESNDAPADKMLSSSPTSPSITTSYVHRESSDGFSVTKRPLAEVREELLGRDLDLDIGNPDENYFFDDSKRNRFSRTGSAASVPETMSSSLHSYGSEGLDPSSQLRQHFKKQRSGDARVSRSNSDMGNRLSSICNRWKTRSGAGPKLSIETGHARPSFSRSTSRTNSAGSNVASPALSMLSKPEYTLPPSPARTLFEEPIAEDNFPSPRNANQENPPQEEEEQKLATTPLLPPLLVNLSSRYEEPVQSPLQSPSIAETPILSTPSPLCTPQIPMLPSPPLSSRPSVASMRQRSRAPTLVPASEIPVFELREAPDDIWSQKLGHANYTILPEPYEAAEATLDAYKQFREDWDSARSNYIKHLARTGEHYGTTSKTYKLTEEKWAEINSQWQRLNKTLNSRLDRDDAATLQSSPHRTEPTTTATRLPTDDPSSPGKFPKLGDEDIVGPMPVAPSVKQPCNSNGSSPTGKKRTFFKFLADLLGRGTGLKA